MSVQHCPKEFLHYLDDESGLCVAVCVWVSRQAQELDWRSGRLVSAKWKMEELFGRREEIISGDKLKFAMVVRIIEEV